MHINLLPRSLQVRLLLRRRLRQWTLVWWTCAAMASLPPALGYREVVALQQSLRRIDNECQPLREMEKDITLLRQQASDDDAHAARITGLAGDHPWRLLDIVARSALQTHGRLQLQRFVFSSNAAPAPATAASGAAQASADPAVRSALSLQGITADDLAIARFVSGLRTADFFHSVVLKSSNELRTADQALRQYEVECHY